MTNFFDVIPNSVLNKLEVLDLSIENSNSCTMAVNEALAKTVLAGGKRLRPMLTYLVAELFGVQDKRVNEAARAIEMVHGASLAHDDVIDNATQRRGMPSINIVESNKKAVLAGDYLLSEVIFRLASIGDLKIIQEMSEVIKDLSVGEWVQSDAIIDRNYSVELIEKIAQYKTASVMSFCTWSPAHIASAPLNIVNDSKEMGRRIGLAFQLMDDTLDFSENSDKDALLDVKNNIVNSVILEWLELNPEKFKAYKNGEDLINLWSEENLVTAVSNIKERAENHMNVAMECLINIQNYLISSGLEESKVEQKLVPLTFIMNFILNRDH